MLETDNGVAAAAQSLLGVLAMVKGGGLDRFWTDTEVYRCKGGNQQLAERFLGRLNKRVQRVILKAEVTSIEKRGTEVWAEADIDGKHEDLGPFR